MEKQAEKAANSVPTALSEPEKYHFRSHLKLNTAFQSRML